MTERRVDTELWAHPDFQALRVGAKLLYLYSWSNSHCNAAGIYRISLETIAFETGLNLGDIPGYLEELKSLDIEWNGEQKVLWVKKFVKHQGRSPKFLEAVSSALRQMSDQDLVSEFLLYNHDIMSELPVSSDVSLTRRECVAIRDRFICAYCEKQISEPRDYEMDHIIPVSRKGLSNYANLVSSCRGCNQTKLDRLPGEAGFKTPTPASFHASQALYVLKNDPAILNQWLMVFPERKSTYPEMLAEVGNNQQQIGYSLDSDSDSDSVKTQTKTQYSGVDTPYMDSLKERFPNVDIHSEWADCQTWWAEHGKTMKAPRSALTNWLKNHAKRNGNVERPYTGR